MRDLLPTEKAKLVGRMRDALAVLGYKVPPAPRGSYGTPQQLVQLLPEVERYAAARGPRFVEQIAKLPPLARAQAITTAAEEDVVRLGPMAPLTEVLGVFASAVTAFKDFKRKAGSAMALAEIGRVFTAALRHT